MTGPACSACRRPTPDGVVLCTACFGQLVTALRSVPGVVADIAVAAARLDRATPGRIGGRSADTPLPERLGLRKPVADLADVVRRWAIITAAGHQVCPSRRHLTELALEARDQQHRPRDPAALALIPVQPVEIHALWLAHHPAWLRGHPSIGDAHQQITTAVARARAACDRPQLRFYGWCRTRDTAHEQQCGAELYAATDADLVACRRCGTKHPGDQLRDQLLMDARSALATREELLAVLHVYTGTPVPAGTFYSWRSRGRLRPAGWLHRDERYGDRITDHWISRTDPPVFRVGDALALLDKTPSTTTE
ncbi:hypothetical protein [Skermania piniformis]|uniref:Uncharacterized protein n=1 Tax=Skermania pinensis TaxID=39122 RepID=A0ABX8SAQ6_9ACTN|nr:hypothetical protein [Skermania piniformis]QXQ14863.1 hypothetical protein KV203_05630 [Skermania piniformis]